MNTIMGRWMPAMIGAALLTTASLAQQTPVQQGDQVSAAAKSDAQPEAAPASPAGGSSEVLDQVMQQMQRNPALEPAPTAAPGSGTSGAAPVIKLGVDAGVLGVAPGMPAPRLRREGDFVISRRGRIVPSPSGDRTLFAFESDSARMVDPPMFLVPCQTLESMEQLVQERGDRIVFILSGQILEYRGSNHLLPTMMKLDIDRGNLNR